MLDLKPLELNREDAKRTKITNPLRVLRAFAVVLLFEGNYAFSVQLNIQCMPYLSVSDPNKSPQNIC